MTTAHLDLDTSVRTHRRSSAASRANYGTRSSGTPGSVQTELVGRTAVLVYACDDHGRAAVCGDVYDVRFPFRSMHAGQAVRVVAQHGDVLLLSANTASRAPHGVVA